MRNHGAEMWPAVQLSNYAGKRIAETLDQQEAFEGLKELAMQGHARLSELRSLGRAVHPNAIDAGSEEAAILRHLLFGEDSELCQGQHPAHMLWRQASLLLMLHFLREAGGIDGDIAGKFRWSCMAGHLPDGRAWTIPVSLSDAAKAWGAYQRNDLLNYCLECLFYAALQEVDRAALRPTELVKVLAERAMASVPDHDGLPSLPALRTKVSEWLAASRASDISTGGDPWASRGIRALADRLTAAIDDGEMGVVPALAARVLGRLAAARDAGGGHPFAPIPTAVEMASNHEVQLRRWWDRVESRGSESTASFLEELLLEWVIYRHLRVATRKLANQGVSTFKFRPEEGRLLLVAERLPWPTFTAPRVKQGFRIVEDLHCVRRVNGDAELSKIGKALLEAHHV